MRAFNTGATRDNDANKLDFEGFLSPIVLTRYAEYLHKHRKQADGKLRSSDNWQKLFGEEHYNVCMKSAFRHFIDWWTQHRNFEGKEVLEDSICALIFNAMAYLYKLELEKDSTTVDFPVIGTKQVYISCPIRGKRVTPEAYGTQEANKIVHQNCKMAAKFVDRLKSDYSEILKNVYIHNPADCVLEVFVQQAYKNEVLNEREILNTDYSIIDNCCLVIFFNHEKEFSAGMKKELNHVTKAGIPSITVESIGNLSEKYVIDYIEGAING